MVWTTALSFGNSSTPGGICTDGTYYYAVTGNYLYALSCSSENVFTEITSVDTGLTIVACVKCDGKYIYVLSRNTSGYSVVRVYSFNGISFSPVSSAACFGYYQFVIHSAMELSSKMIGVCMYGGGTNDIEWFHMDLVAQFTADKTVGPAPLTVQFTAT
jgi:hypothetical protein